MASSNKLTTPKDEMGFGPRDQQILPLPLFETTFGDIAKLQFVFIENSIKYLVGCP